MEKVIDIRPVKRQMRASTKEKRLSMDAEIKSSADKKICNKLLNLWSVREAETVLCYVSTPIEVDTREFIPTLLKSGKTVAVPRCEGDKAEMNFYRISSLKYVFRHKYNNFVKIFADMGTFVRTHGESWISLYHEKFPDTCARHAFFSRSR